MRIHPTVHAGGFRQKTKRTIHIPPAGTQQHRREGPPPPKTRPLDIQRLLRTRLVLPLPQAHRTTQREMPMVPGRKCKPTTYNDGMQRHATPYCSLNERTHIQGAGIRGLEPTQAYRGTHAQQSRTARNHLEGHSRTTGRIKTAPDSMQFSLLSHT